MGGFAVAVDWEAPVDRAAFEPMVAEMAHRGPAGIRTSTPTGALLAEARLPRDGTGEWNIATVGSMSLVGDVRLWNTGPLRGLAGVDDPDLRLVLLHAYRAAGADMMDAVDGDFAFAIWDADSATLFAARDRFGVKPLWVRHTPNGIHLASGTGQLVAASDPRPDPDEVTVARFLRNEVPYDDRSFHEGISRLMPAHTLTATAAGSATTRYWDPSVVPPRPVDDPAAAFRDHLVDAVRRRLAGATRSVSHLSGGLDSSSITASAHALVDEGLDAGAFITVSAVIPGPDTDESAWITEIAAGQPFPHREFTPRIGPIDDYIGDMTATGTPIAHHIRDLTVRTAEIAVEEGADLLLTGNGGDDVANDRWVLTELIRRGEPRAWARAVGAMGGDSPGGAALWAASSVGSALPERIKRLLRPRTGADTTPSLLAAPLRDLPVPAAVHPTARTSHPTAIDLENGRGLALREYQEAIAARHGVEVTHPYLDRALVEFVVSIPTVDRPVALGNKALIRGGFRGCLPDAVLDRVDKTLGNAQIARVIRAQGPRFAERYPEVPPTTLAWVDPEAYRAAVDGFLRTPEPSEVHPGLWPAWSLMVWVDHAR